MGKRGPEQAARGSCSFLYLQRDSQVGRDLMTANPKPSKSPGEFSRTLFVASSCGCGSFLKDQVGLTALLASPCCLSQAPQEGPPIMLQVSAPSSLGVGRGVGLASYGSSSPLGKLREGIQRGLGKWALASQTNSPGKGAFLGV